MTARGEVWWAEIGPRRGSRPAGTRPVVVVQADPYNRSRIATVVAVILTTNTGLADAPGNVYVAGAEVGLPRDSIANVTQIVTLNRSDLRDRAGRLGRVTMRAVDEGLRRVLAL